MTEDKVEDVVSKPNLGISPSKMIAEISMYALDWVVIDFDADKQMEAE